MSIDLFVTMLDFDRFRAVYGSKDKCLLRSIVAANRDAIGRHDDYFRDCVGGGRYSSIEVALQQIIDGTVDRCLEPRFQFEHAVAMIADSMGKPLESEVLMEVKESFWREVNVVLRRCRSTSQVPEGVWPTLDDVLKRGPFLNIPLHRMRLGSGYLTANEVRRADEAVLDEVAVGDSALNGLTWPDRALEAVEAYRSWIRAAAAERHDLYFHR